MNKKQFLAALESGLAGLPPCDIEKSLDYYNELIDDHIEDGMSEEQAVEDMGSLDFIIAQILSETPVQRLIKEKIRPARKMRTWEIVLLILGSPVWIPLLLAAVMVILALYMVIWSLVLVMYAVVIAFAAGGLGGIFGSIVNLLTGNPVQALMMLSAGLVCVGLTIFCFIAFNHATLGIIKASKSILIWVKSLFLRKGDAK